MPPRSSYASIAFSSRAMAHGSSFRVMAGNEFGETMSAETVIEVEIPYLSVEVVMGVYRVWVEGPPGEMVRVERSSDLADWQEWWTIATTGQRLSRDFLPAGAPAQFFRAEPMSP